MAGDSECFGSNGDTDYSFPVSLNFAAAHTGEGKTGGRLTAPSALILLHRQPPHGTRRPGEGPFPDTSPGSRRQQTLNGPAGPREGDSSEQSSTTRKHRNRQRAKASKERTDATISVKAPKNQQDTFRGSEGKPADARGSRPNGPRSCQRSRGKIPSNEPPADQGNPA